jgi:hypothetical protein
LAIIKCIYLPSTYLHFIQGKEDRCLLLTSSMSFVDLPFQEHRMMEKHHMDQNLCISSLCPKQGIVTDNMTQGNDVAQSTGSTEPRCGRPAMCSCISKNRFVYVSCRGGAQGIQCPKAVQGENLAAWASCMASQPDRWAPGAQSSATAQPYSYKYHGAPPGRKCEESEV